MGLDEAATKPHEALAAHLSDKLEAVNRLIRERMASRHAPRIPEVTAHLVEAGGKRLRPMLTLAAADLCGYRGAHDVRLAATVEFIHTATLLHDDVVDESASRRGRPTANLLWDNKSSVLVGDYLFARAFQLMVETESLRVLDITGIGLGDRGGPRLCELLGNGACAMCTSLKLGNNKLSDGAVGQLLVEVLVVGGVGTKGEGAQLTQ